jgi:hypothetical protein
MAHRFSAGDTVYGKDGRSYTVEAIDGNTVYCTSSNGTETEFPLDMLLTQATWTQSEPRANHAKREISYPRLRQSRHYLTGTHKIASAAAEQLLARTNNLFPSLLDFAAFTMASRILAEHKEEDLIDQLSIVKSRAVFDDAPAPVRARVLAEFLEAQPDALASAAGLGDNLLRAMIDKGLAPHESAFDEFQDRPRK